MSSGNYVGLNVGGRIYRTSRVTLNTYADTFFSPIFEGEIPSEKDEHGNFMIDRDGKMFRHVLNFMRNGRLILPDGFDELELLKREADFFLVEEMIVALKEMEKEKEARKRDEEVGFTINGMIFKLNKHHVLQESQSLLAKWIYGTAIAPVDTFGNFIVKREEDTILHVLNYLQKGAITSENIKEKEIQSLETEAKYFEMNILLSQVQTVYSVYHSNGFENPKFVLYYYTDRSFSFHLKDPCQQKAASIAKGPGCIAYITREQPRQFEYDTSSFLPVIPPLDNDTLMFGGFRCRVVDLEKINEKDVASLEDVISYYSLIFGEHRDSFLLEDESWIVRRKITANCTKVAFLLERAYPTS